MIQTVLTVFNKAWANKTILLASQFYLKLKDVKKKKKRALIRQNKTYSRAKKIEFKKNWGSTTHKIFDMFKRVVQMVSYITDHYSWTFLKKYILRVMV